MRNKSHKLRCGGSWIEKDSGQKYAFLLFRRFQIIDLFAELCSQQSLHFYDKDILADVQTSEIVRSKLSQSLLFSHCNCQMWHENWRYVQTSFIVLSEVGLLSCKCNTSSYVEVMLFWHIVLAKCCQNVRSRAGAELLNQNFHNFPQLWCFIRTSRLARLCQM